MAITVEASGQHQMASGSSSYTLSLPAGIQEDDIVLVGVSSDEDGSSGNLEVKDGGGGSTYTSVHTMTGESPEGALSFKRMGSTPDTQFQIDNTATTNTDVVAIVMVLRGVDTTTALSGTPVELEQTTHGGMPDPPSMTTADDDALVVAFGAQDDDDVASSVTAPSGYTLQVAEDTGNGSTSVGTTVMFATKTKASAGSEDPGAFGGSGSDKWWAVTLAFKPGPTSVNTDVNLDALSYTLTLQDVGVAIGYSVSLDTLTYTQTLEDVSITAGRTVSLDTIDYTLSLPSVSISQSVTVDLDTLEYTQTLLDISIPVGRVIDLDTVEYTLSLPDIGVQNVVSIALDTLSYTLTLPSTTIVRGVSVALDQIVYECDLFDLGIQVTDNSANPAEFPNEYSRRRVVIV